MWPTTFAKIIQYNAGEKRWQRRRRIIKRKVGGGDLGLTGEILADLDSLANLGDPVAVAAAAAAAAEEEEEEEEEEEDPRRRRPAVAGPEAK